MDQKWRALFEQWSGKEAVPAAQQPAPVNPSPAPVATAPVATPAAKPQVAAVAPAQPVAAAPAQDQVVPLRGPAKAVASNMEESLSVPTATTVRAIPAKLLIDNRTEINKYLARTRGGKVSFTHIIGYAIVRALDAFPSMNVSYGADEKGRPAAIQHADVNFGLAIDLPRPDGSRNLVVPNIKGAQKLSFSEF